MSKIKAKDIHIGQKVKFEGFVEVTGIGFSPQSESVAVYFDSHVLSLYPDTELELQPEPVTFTYEEGSYEWAVCQVMAGLDVTHEMAANVSSIMEIAGARVRLKGDCNTGWSYARPIND